MRARRLLLEALDTATVRYVVYLQAESEEDAINRAVEVFEERHDEPAAPTSTSAPLTPAPATDARAELADLIQRSVNRPHSRREFLRRIGAATAGIAAGPVGPAGPGLPKAAKVAKVAKKWFKLSWMEPIEGSESYDAYVQALTREEAEKKALELALPKDWKETCCDPKDPEEAMDMLDYWLEMSSFDTLEVPPPNHAELMNQGFFPEGDDGYLRTQVNYGDEYMNEYAEEAGDDDKLENPTDRPWWKVWWHKGFNASLGVKRLPGKPDSSKLRELSQQASATGMGDDIFWAEETAPEGQPFTVSKNDWTA